MKALLLVIILLFTSHLYAQEKWERLGPVSFTGIDKLASGIIVACTDAGSVYTSTDEGSTWSHKLVDGQRAFYCIRFADNLRGIIGSNKGIILKTTDAGVTWRKYSVGTTSNIIEIAYPHRDTAFVCTEDGSVYRSFKSGIVWEKVSFEQTKPPLFNQPVITCLAFATSTYGFLGAKYSVLLKTTDGGNTWTDESGFNNKDLTAIDITEDGKVAYVSTDPFITTTLNQFNWKSIPFDKGDTLKHIVTSLRIQNDTVFAFQKDSKYWITLSFGGQWKAKRLLPPSEISNPTYDISPSITFNDMYFDGQTGIGIVVGSRGTIYRFDNSGNIGELLHHCNAGYDDNSIGVNNSWMYMKGLASNSNSIHGIGLYGPFVWSSDGGATWLTRVEKNYGFASYFDLHFTDEHKGLILTANRKQPVAEGFLNTNDNGATWGYEAQPPNDNMYSFTKSVTSKCYITGDSSIYISSDDGFTWSRFHIFDSTSPFDTSLHHVTHMIRNMSILNNDSLMFLNVIAFDSVLVDTVTGSSLRYAVVLASTDAGKTWENRHRFPYRHITQGQRFISEQLGYALTYYSPSSNSTSTLLWRTTDAGYTWDTVTSTSSNTLRSPLTFSQSGKYGIITDYSGSGILISTDSGYTWTPDTLEYYLGSQNIKFLLSYFIDDSTALVTSKDGFWKKSFGQIKSAVQYTSNKDNPIKISATPNPSMSTDIVCTIEGLSTTHDKRSMSVRLIDISGNEIRDLTTLAQEHRDTDSRSFVIDTKRLPSGSYIIQVSTSDGGASVRTLIIK
jgi:photosystem II stability/assembly factor-like uncharacterized protein